MPPYYKWPSYVGNVLLLLAGLIIAAKNSSLAGSCVVALAALNLYLTWKLDVFSREEVWLASEIKKAKMRDELLAVQKQVAEHEEAAAQRPSRQAPDA